MAGEAPTDQAPSTSESAGGVSVITVGARMSRATSSASPAHSPQLVEVERLE